MTKDEIITEKQIRIMAISMTPILVAPFAVGFYFLYLKTMGLEVPLWVLLNYSLLAIAVSSIISLTLNDVLLRLSGERFRFRRLVFRWTLLTSYYFLVWATSFGLTVFFPWAGALFQFLFGVLVATAIFLIIALRLRHLFGRLDKGEW